MFCASVFNGDISKWDVSNVTNMNNMFEQSSFDGDLSLWNCMGLECVNEMFYDAKAPVPIHIPRLEQVATGIHPFTQWCPCSLAYWSVLKGELMLPKDYQFLPQFNSLVALCDNLNMSVTQTAEYIYQQLHGVQSPSYMELDHGTNHLF
jgi:surface protein